MKFEPSIVGNDSGRTLCLPVMKDENFRGAGIFCLLFVATKSESPIKGEKRYMTQKDSKNKSDIKMPTIS